MPAAIASSAPRISHRLFDFARRAESMTFDGCFAGPTPSLVPGCGWLLLASAGDERFCDDGAGVTFGMNFAGCVGPEGVAALWIGGEPPRPGLLPDASC